MTLPLCSLDLFNQRKKRHTLYWVATPKGVGEEGGAMCVCVCVLMFRIQQPRFGLNNKPHLSTVSSAPAVSFWEMNMSTSGMENLKANLTLSMTTSKGPELKSVSWFISFVQEKLTISS